MLRAINCILIILILLLTALFGLIALLIIATEQPDGLLDKLYLNSHQAKNVRNDSRVFALKTTQMETSTVKFTTKMSTAEATAKMSTTDSTTTEMMSTKTTEAMSSTTLNYNATLAEDFDLENAAYHKLQPFDLKLKLTNSEKVMSIGMENGERFYVAKANGELEFFNWTNLDPVQTEHLDVQVHRLVFLSDGRLVVTETQTKTLHLLDPDYKVIAQLKLGYQALDLQVFNDMVRIV